MAPHAVSTIFHRTCIHQGAQVGYGSQVHTAVDNRPDHVVGSPVTFTGALIPVFNVYKGLFLVSSDAEMEPFEGGPVGRIGLGLISLCTHKVWAGGLRVEWVCCVPNSLIIDVRVVRRGPHDPVHPRS